MQQMTSTSRSLPMTSPRRSRQRVPILQRKPASPTSENRQYQNFKRTDASQSSLSFHNFWFQPFFSSVSGLIASYFITSLQAYLHDYGERKNRVSSAEFETERLLPLKSVKAEENKHDKMAEVGAKGRGATLASSQAQRDKRSLWSKYSSRRLKKASLSCCVKRENSIWDVVPWLVGYS